MNTFYYSGEVHIPFSSNYPTNIAPAALQRAKPLMCTRGLLEGRWMLLGGHFGPHCAYYHHQEADSDAPENVCRVGTGEMHYIVMTEIMFCKRPASVRVRQM